MSESNSQTNLPERSSKQKQLPLYPIQFLMHFVLAAIHRHNNNIARAAVGTTSCVTFQNA